MMNEDIYTIDMTNESKSLKEVLKDHDYELTKQIILKIFYAIDNELETIDIAEIIIPGESIMIHCSEPFFYNTLTTNMNTMIEYEEYELCSEIVEYKKIIEKKI
jgi:hypothetical protein